ncbi:MAG: hypothetical protein OEU26_32350 [Candidatus Tectomicrobia bacterium]|nr:hypothetical protein [Candidatus Tectomicrobia bacterium]
MGRRRSLQERFWSKVDIQGDDECWIWTAKRNRYGYGEFNLDNVRRSAQAYVIAYIHVMWMVSTQREIGFLYIGGVITDTIKDMVRK